MTLKVVSASEDGLFAIFRFADDIVVNAEEEEEADIMVDRLNTTTTRYKMEIGPDKTKVMTNNPNGFQREIKIKGQRLEVVENLGSSSLMKDKNQRLSFQYCRASSCFYTKDHMEGQKQLACFWG